MKHEIKPQESARAKAFELWMSSPMPMVTLTKTFDVTNIIKTSRHKGVKFNALMCWCIAKAASHVEHFYTLPEQGKLYAYTNLAVNVIVKTQSGGINSCDIPFDDNFVQFIHDYDKLTTQVSEECKSIFMADRMIIGTSAMVETEIDSIVNQYTDKFYNPMVMWGKYRKQWFRTTLPISFQFHHVQMDGGDAAHFLELLQREIYTI